MKTNQQCPICGCKEIGQGRQMGHGAMMPLNKFWSAGAYVLADICTDCGHILSMKVDQPHKFKTTKRETY